MQEDKGQLIGLTINPWIRADHAARWKLEFCNLGLDSFVFQCILLHHQDFWIIPIAMLIGAKANIGLNNLSREVDDSFVEFVLRGGSAPLSPERRTEILPCS